MCDPGLRAASTPPNEKQPAPCIWRRWYGAAGAFALLAFLTLALAGPAGAAPPPNVAVTPAEPPPPAGVPLAFQSPALAVDPVNPAHLAIAYHEAFQDRQCLLALSSNRGRTWSTRVVVGDGGLISLTGQQVQCLYPKIAYGPTGVLYYLYQTPRADFRKPRQVLIATSHDGGATFGAPVLLDSMTDRTVYAQLALAVDRASGRVYASWTNAADPNNRRILVASSADQGRTFSAPVRVSSPAQAIVANPSLVVDVDGTLHVGWLDFPDGADPTSPSEPVYVAASKDHGRSFGSPTEALRADPGCGTAPIACTRPVQYAADNVSFDLARGTSAGHLFAVGWVPEGGVLTANRRLVFSSSQDGGAHWTASRVVGIPVGAGDDQVRPSITVTPEGRIEIVYQDLPAADPPGAAQSIFELHSDDGGRTFAAPRQLNSAPSDISIGPRSFVTLSHGRAANLGAHLAVASSDTGVFFAWTDTRRGSSISGDQDIFFAAVPTPPVLSRFSLSPRPFAVIHSGRRRHMHRGTTIRFALSEPASVRFAFSRLLVGRVARRRCVGVTHANRRHRHCTRLVGAGSFVRAGRRGQNHLFFSGRVGRRALAPGRYELTLAAIDPASNRSIAVSQSFRVVAG